MDMEEELTVAAWDIVVGVIKLYFTIWGVHGKCGGWSQDVQN